MNHRHNADPQPPPTPDDDGRCELHGRYLCPLCAAARVAVKRAARLAEKETR